MVWFQCEDCGEDLKKPKLPNHFRSCSASKFSCIDCGQEFGKQNVQLHTQCISEAEKYGPKSQGKVSNGKVGRPDNVHRQQEKSDIDLSVGLSERPPWFCSFCNTKATSRQALLLHAEGKKHKAKARAFHASNQQPANGAESVPQNKSPDNTPSKQQKTQDVVSSPEESEAKEEPLEHHPQPKDACGEKENGLAGKRKRQLDIIVGNLDKQPDSKEDKSLLSEDVSEHKVKKIKWKKIITPILKSEPSRSMELKDLRKLVLKTVRESGVGEDKNHVNLLFDSKINSCSRFKVVGKHVSLTPKE